MHMPLNPALAATDAPPVMAARRWLDEVTLPPDLPLLNVSQAAPVDPPPEALRRAMAETCLHDPSAHLYGPVLGLPALRAAVAEHFSDAYRAELKSENVAITQGCNQAFCAALATVAGHGDEVILPYPWYFNHKMWLDMAGVRAVPLATGDTLLPDPDAAEALITERSRAIVLVTPNNPGGIEYPAETVSLFRDLCQRRNLALIIDETYRDFDSRTGPPHELLCDPDWSRTVIQLYSFSKAYRLTGHRVGAMIAAPARLAEVEKFLDTVAICPAQIGQHGALWGMRNLAQWLAGERAEILSRRQAVSDALQGLEGWRLLGCGAYFAYVEHPFEMASDALARHLVGAAGILLLPGTMFVPAGATGGGRQLRIAFANVDEAGIGELARRLAALDLPRR